LVGNTWFDDVRIIPDLCEAEVGLVIKTNNKLYWFNNNELVLCAALS